MGQKGWDPGSGTTVLKSAVDVRHQRRLWLVHSDKGLKRARYMDKCHMSFKGRTRTKVLHAWIRNLKDMPLDQSTMVFHGITLA